MDFINNISEQINVLTNSSEIMAYIDHNLLLLIFVSLAFGFAGLLVEIRLPLKYYWDLPAFFARPFAESLGILKKIPAWGKCFDNRTNQYIPVTAIELLNKKDMSVQQVTFSDRLGNYGFKVKPGTYVVRAIKNNYIAPPFFDPENIQLNSTDESLALPVDVVEGETPQLNLVLQPSHVTDRTGWAYRLLFLFRTFTITLVNGFLLLAIVNSWYGWVIKKSPLFAVLLATSIVFMFIKLYILEAVGSASRS